ncbi:MAG: DUF4010 domain-containing protein [Candidatus Nanohaloarchaea archaeon]|nr:DUF4010 domain-containing protein [Candidatus Nanohaloarchaea archaeon]
MAFKYLAAQCAGMAMIAVPELLQEVLLALAIGGLIGLERENEPQRKYAGLRTLALLCGAGPAIVSLAEHTGSMFLTPLYLGLAVMLSLSIVGVRVFFEEGVGFTTSMAAFMVAILGLLVGYNMYFEATALTIFTVTLLAEKEKLHDYLGKLTDDEISDAMKLGLLVFVLLPILPAKPVDPLGAIHLQKVLVLAIFVLLIEFVAFISMRQLEGSHGLYLTGLLGGVANSFATMGVLARISNQNDSLRGSVSAAAMLATVSMIVRNVTIAAAIQVTMLTYLWKPAAVMVVVALVLGYIMRDDVAERDFAVPMDSPFSFVSAAKFSLAFIAIAVVSTLAESVAGSYGLYATAYVGGLVSSTAVATSAVTLLTGGTASLPTAAGMVLIGIFASISSKMFLVETVNRDLRRTVTASLLVIGLAGLGVFFLL